MFSGYPWNPDVNYNIFWIFNVFRLVVPCRALSCFVVPLVVLIESLSASPESGKAQNPWGHNLRGKKNYMSEMGGVFPVLHLAAL